MRIFQKILRLELYTNGMRWRMLLGKVVRQLFPNFHLRRHLASLFGRSVKVSVLGKTLSMDLRDDAMSATLFAVGVWEPEETHFIEKTLKPGMVFADVGANIGYYTVIASGKVGSGGKVFAFEPDPKNFALLQENIDTNGCKNVVAVQKAVTASGENLILYRSNNNFGDHRVYEPQNESLAGCTRSAIRIESVSLDQYFDLNLTRVDLLKMDIQGSEYDAFIGMRKLVERNPNIIILTEFWPRGLMQAGASPPVFLDEVRKSGFKIFQVDAQGPREVSDHAILADLYEDRYTNLLFSRKDLSPW
jgi:FkbM family methyltransferase